MNAEQLTPEQVTEIARELREADYNKAGNDFFAERVTRLHAAGWVLGIIAYSHKITKGRRGRKLAIPKNEWRNIAHWYHIPSGIKVWYWDNHGYSKQQAQQFAKDNPPPNGSFQSSGLWPAYA